MAFVDRIRHCNSYEPSRAVPLWAGEHRVGLLRRDNAEVLARHDKVFSVTRERAPTSVHSWTLAASTD
jgi:hypothetical protein